MKNGHGITGRKLQDLCAEGKLKAPGERVLLEAILEEHAGDSAILEGIEIDMRKAIAFRVADVGPEVPWELKPGDVVINVSISGEKIDHTDKSCPWVVVHYRDLVAVVPGLLT